MTPEERRLYDREWYKKNKKKRQELNTKWENKQLALYLEFKATLYCKHCNENDPVCLEFHHINPSEKEVDIGRVFRNWSIKRLKAEIDKCIVLCANCHRKEHARLKVQSL